MKKIITCAAAFVTMAANAQTIEITHYHDGKIVNNNSSIYLNSYVDSTVYYELRFKNVGAAQASVSVKRNIDMLHTVGTQTAETYFCTGIDCYTPDVFSANLVLAANESISFIHYLKEISSKGESSISYRVQSSATDISYSFKYNNILGVTDHRSGAVKAFVMPNPASAQAQLSINAGKAMNAGISLIDLTGATVWENPEIGLQTGTNILELPVENLSEGVYFVRVSTPEFQSTEKLILVK